MKALAIVIDDSELFAPWRLFLLCAYLPALVIASSWLLIRWKKSLVILALGISLVSAGAIISALRRDEIRSEAIMRLQPNAIPLDPAYIRAAWFAAAFPATMVPVLLACTKKEPNQSPQPTAPSRRG